MPFLLKSKPRKRKHNDPEVSEEETHATRVSTSNDATIFTPVPRRRSLRLYMQSIRENATNEAITILSFL